MVNIMDKVYDYLSLEEKDRTYAESNNFFCFYYLCMTEFGLDVCDADRYALLNTLF